MISLYLDCFFFANHYVYRTTPKKYNPQQSYVFSGKRVKRGLYRSKTGILINADVNGAYNILRKSKPKFGITHLPKDRLEGWLHPCK